MATAATRKPSSLDESIVQDPSGHEAVSLGTQIAGEDLTNDVMKVEQRYSYANVTADALVKTGAGFLHSVTFSQTAVGTAVTPGNIVLYDNTAESGTIIASFVLPATTQAPVTVVLDVAFSTGLYAGFTTLAGANATISYR